MPRNISSFAPMRATCTADGCDYSNEGGGKSGSQSGHFRFVRAVFQGVSLKFHWRLDKSSPLPTTSTALTTLYHFCPHPTPNWFIVNKKVRCCGGLRSAFWKSASRSG